VAIVFSEMLLKKWRRIGRKSIEGSGCSFV